VVARRRAQTAHTPSMFSHFILFALFALFALFILCERSFCLFWHPWSIGSGIHSAAWFLVDVLGLCTPELLRRPRAVYVRFFYKPLSDRSTRQTHTLRRILLAAGASHMRLCAVRGKKRTHRIDARESTFGDRQAACMWTTKYTRAVKRNSSGLSVLFCRL
jgi:hypothetical protein